MYSEMSAHTPGPWTVGEDGDVIWGAEWEGRKTYVASVPFNKTPRTKADARLIATAPELLEACQTFAEWLRREDEGLPAGIERGTPEGERQWRIWWEENLRICDLAQKQVIAAIAKATGEQS